MKIISPKSTKRRENNCCKPLKMRSWRRGSWRRATSKWWMRVDRKLGCSPSMRNCRLRIIRSSATSTWSTPSWRRRESKTSKWTWTKKSRKEKKPWRRSRRSSIPGRRTPIRICGWSAQSRWSRWPRTSPRPRNSSKSSSTTRILTKSPLKDRRCSNMPTCPWTTTWARKTPWTISTWNP